MYEFHRSGCRRVWVTLMPAMPVLLALTGCAELPASAWTRMLEAKTNYEHHDYRAASTQLTGILKQYPQHPDSAGAYYLRALCNTRLSNKVQAEADARHCIELSKESDLTVKAHATLATLLYEANRTREALPHFSAAIEGLPERPPTDLLRYRYGLCLQREGRWKEARLQFAAVFQHYARSPTRQQSRRMYNWHHDFYSIQCGAFRDKQAAEKLNQKLKSSGLKSRVESRTRDGEPLYRVYVGRYARYTQARDALPSVQRQVSDALVVPQ